MSGKKNKEQNPVSYGQIMIMGDAPVFGLGGDMIRHAEITPDGQVWVYGEDADGEVGEPVLMQRKDYEELVKPRTQEAGLRIIV